VGESRPSTVYPWRLRLHIRRGHLLERFTTFCSHRSMAGSASLLLPSLSDGPQSRGYTESPSSERSVNLFAHSQDFRVLLF
jgi:hypothetical protein